MKNLLICLLLILAGSSPVLSAYGTEEILLENSNIEQQEIVEADTSEVNVGFKNVGDPQKKVKSETKQKPKKVVKVICKRPIAKRGNMGNSGAMRNMYAAKLTSLP